MGYETYYNFYVTRKEAPRQFLSEEDDPVTGKIIDELRASSPEAAYAIDDEGNAITGISTWDNAHEIILKLSKKYPDYLLCLHGDGDGTMDIWETWFLNGKSEHHDAEIPEPDIFGTKKKGKVYNRRKSAPFIRLENKCREMKKLISKLKREIKRIKESSVEWSVEDILETADNDDIKISKAAAGRVLRRMIAKHDASLGITWDTISIYLQEWEQNPEKFH